MRLCFLVTILTMAAITPLQAGFFSFDLTNLVGDNFVTPFPEAEVDLGLEFGRITAAEFRVTGTFHPGTMRAVGPEPNTNPLVPSDLVFLSSKVGEIGTAYFQKPLYAGATLSGMQGPIDIHFPLIEIGQPAIYPPVHSSTSFNPLLDGKFGLSAGMIHTVASLYQVIESPRFEVVRFTLRIEGMLVPEPPATLLLLLCVAMSNVATTRHRRPG